MADAGTGTILGQPNPTHVYNVDIAGLADRIVRFAKEMQLDAQASNNLVTPADQTRLGSYLAAVDAFHNWILSAPVLDLVKTNYQYPIDPMPDLTLIDNESLEDVVRYLQVCWREITLSRSASMPNGLLSFDSVRLRANTTKIQHFLSEYIAKTDPLDLPQSSPQFAHAPAGSPGI